MRRFSFLLIHVISFTVISRCRSKNCLSYNTPKDYSLMAVTSSFICPISTRYSMSLSDKQNLTMACHFIKFGLVKIKTRYNQIFLTRNQPLSPCMSLKTFSSSTITASECLIQHVIFGVYCRHGEWLVKLCVFQELLNLLLAASIRVHSRIQCLLVTCPEALHMVHD